MRYEKYIYIYVCKYVYRYRKLNGKIDSKIRRHTLEYWWGGGRGSEWAWWGEETSGPSSPDECQAQPATPSNISLILS